MNKKMYAIILIFSIVFIIGIITFMIFNLNKSSNDKLASNTESNNVISNDTLNLPLNQAIKTSSSEIKISPNCSITFHKHFLKCGHTIKEKSIATQDIVKFSKDEFEELYSDWQVSKFSSLEIDLEKNFDGLCGQHYLVKSDNGYVKIYNIKSDNFLELEEATEIAVKYLSLEDMNELENGVILYGKENLNSYIENFE